MKKLIFILCVSFFIANAFASTTESEVSESSNIEFLSNSNYAIYAKRCCTRTVRNADGESWSATRCVDLGDSHIAMGRACEMATQDANTAMQQASSYTVTVVVVD